MWRWVALGLLTSVGACSTSDEGKRPEDAPPKAPDEQAPEHSIDEPIDWTNCSLVPEQNDYGAQCAVAYVPRDHADPNGATIPIALKRIVAKSKRRGTIWLLDGGPGSSGVERLQSLAGQLPDLVEDHDLITFDHRGVGGSERLGCPQEDPASEGGRTITDTEWPGCIVSIEKKYGLSLAHFSTTAAARDLGQLVPRLRRGTERTFVWGGSYGAYLALRYMHLFPDQADGVILEGIAGPDLDFSRYSADMNEVGKQYFARCAADPICGAKLGPDPFATARSVVASLDKGHCSVLQRDTAWMRSFLGGLLSYELLRVATAPLVYRMKRCSADDVAAIKKFLGGFQTASEPPPSDSEALFHQIAVAEFWRPPGVTLNAAKAELDGLTTAAPLTFNLARVAPAWPAKVARPDAYHGRLPEFAKPLLMLQGGLDPQTPAKYTEPLRVKYTGPNQTYALFPDATHLPTNGTREAQGGSCALSLYTQFVRNPTAPLDTSCIANTEPIDFMSKGQSLPIFGTSDPWD